MSLASCCALSSREILLGCCTEVRYNPARRRPNLPLLSAVCPASVHPLPMIAAFLTVIHHQPHNLPRPRCLRHLLVPPPQSRSLHLHLPNRRRGRTGSPMSSADKQSPARTHREYFPSLPLLLQALYSTVIPYDYSVAILSASKHAGQVLRS